MSNTAVGGFSAMTLLDGYDLSVLGKAVTMNQVRDDYDCSVFLNKDKQSCVGMRGGTITFEGIRKGSLPEYQALVSGIFDGNDAPHNVLYAPEGGEFGKAAYLLLSHETAMPVTSPVSGVIQANATFTATGGIKPATILVTSRGTDSISGDEVQTFTFTSTSEHEKLGVGYSGGPGVYNFDQTPAGVDVSLKSALEQLFPTGTWTVTGSLTTTGSTPDRTYSGTLTATASGTIADEDLAQVVVASGEVTHAVATPNADSGDYSIGGSANFAAGDTISAIRTKIQAVGGNYANIFLNGTSTAAVAGTPSLPVHDADSSVALGSPDTTVTASHIMGAVSHGYLTVRAISDSGIDNDCTGVTFDGVAMTKLTSIETQSGWGAGEVTMWGLAAPASGTHNIVATFAHSGYHAIVNSSWSNVDQSTPQDVAAVQKADDGSGSGISKAIVTSSVNCMIVDALGVASAGSIPVTATASQTVAEQVASLTVGLAGSYKAAASAGSVTMSYSVSGASSCAIAIIALRGYSAPSAAAALDLSLHFPANLGNITQPTGTGTNLVISTTTQGGVAAASVSSTTTVVGSPGEGAFFNVIDADFNGDGVDNTDETHHGGIAVLHATWTDKLTGNSLIVKLQHSTDNSTWVTLATFDTLTLNGVSRKVIADGTTVNRYTRAIVESGSITGSWVFCVAFSRVNAQFGI